MTEKILQSPKEAFWLLKFFVCLFATPFLLVASLTVYVFTLGTVNLFAAWNRWLKWYWDEKPST